MGLEYSILDEILEHKSSKIIYVLTHSDEKLEEDDKKRAIESIKTGIRKCEEKAKEKKKKKKNRL